MDYSKWIEQLIRNVAKGVKEHRKEIIEVLGAAALTSMFWVVHEEVEKSKSFKKGEAKAAQTFNKKYDELLNYCHGLEAKIAKIEEAEKQLLNDMLEEYELAVRKVLQMCKEELARLEAKNNRTPEEDEYMIRVVNDYGNYRLKMFGAAGTSDICFAIGNIAYLNVDCIVNAANKSLLGGGGVDGAIHKAAGEGLLQECKTLNGCKVGEAKLTHGYNLPAHYVIHTVGPRYTGSKQNEIDLSNCYMNSLELARKNDIHTIAFPAISTGAYGYPVKEAAEIALGTISKWLLENKEYPMAVVLCSYEQKTYEIYNSICKKATPEDLAVRYTSEDVHITETKQERKDNTEDVQSANLAGLGFGFIHKTHDVVMDGNKGILVWDYVVYNEISFVNVKTNTTESLFKSLSDKKTEKEFERLSILYSNS